LRKRRTRLNNINTLRARNPFYCSSRVKVVDTFRFLGLGESYHPLPWKVLTYDTRLEGYVIDLDMERLKNAPRYGVGEEPFADPAFGQRLGDYYGAC
jgi:hypothetical protein